MNRVSGLIGIALVALILVAVPAISQNPPAPGAPGAPGERGGPLAAEKTLTGQLVKVDTQAKSISVKGPDQKDMTFTYNDTTQVISPDKTIQGLTGKAGADLKVTYREERGSNLATKIELMEKEK